MLVYIIFPASTITWSWLEREMGWMLAKQQEDRERREQARVVKEEARTRVMVLEVMVVVTVVSWKKRTLKENLLPARLLLLFHR